MEVQAAREGGRVADRWGQILGCPGPFSDLLLGLELVEDILGI